MLHTIDTSRGPFSVNDSGAGFPLVLLHGFPLDHTMWEHQISRFSTSHRVVAIDLRGFGKTPAQRRDDGHVRVRRGCGGA